jgi:nucleoside transporter
MASSAADSNPYASTHSADSSAHGAGGSPRLKLITMMFLQFFIWGAWFPLVFGYLPYLGFTPTQQATILNMFPLSALLAMFVSNQIADKFFAAEKTLAVSHLIGGLAMLGLSQTKDYSTFLALMAVHCFFYVPTISITNAIAFNAMKNPSKEFGPVRMGGTIGWIAAAWPIFFLIGESNDQDLVRWTFVISGIASLALAGFSLVLPHTPPRKDSQAEGWLAFAKAGKSLVVPAILVLWIVTFIDAGVHQLYFNWTGRFLTEIGIEQRWIMPIMSIGQIAEIATMAVLGYFLTRLGWKLTMIIGVLGHAVRFGVFAFLPDQQAVIIAVQVLHGICYAFFFATVYIFVDEFLPKDIRSSAQGLFNFMILGAGPFVANAAAPFLHDELFSGSGRELYSKLFLIPMGTAIVAAVILAVAFHPARRAPEQMPSH